MNTTGHPYAISADTLTRLHKRVNSLGGVISNNPLLPILGNFLLKIEKNQIIIGVSDQQTSIISSISFEGGDFGKDSLEIAVPARMFKDTLRNLPQQPISLLLDKERYNISLQTSNGLYKIACENASDFPNVFSLPKKKADVTLSSTVLLKAIKQTLFATSKDEIRPELSGIFISVNSEGMTFVATDGHRLVSYKRKDVVSEREIKCIVPAKSIQFLQQLLSGEKDKEVKFIFEEKKLFISFDQTSFIISLINETYPDYHNVIPRHNPYLLILNTDCLSALKRIAIYVNRGTKQLRFNIEKEKIEVIAEDLDFSNKAEETLPCQYEGPDMKIGFNAKLLIEMLSVLPAEEDIQFALNTPNKAILVQPPVDTDQEEVSMLIMPISLNA